MADERSELLKGAFGRLQILVGLLAVTICMVVMVTDHALGTQDELRGSLSAYYYGVAGSWFVGALFAMAVFFLVYEYDPREGYRVDRWHSSFAGLCAITVAMAPTASDPPLGTRGEAIVDKIHGTAAALLLITMAVFSLYHFTKTKGEAELKLCACGRAKRLFRTDWAALTNAGFVATPQKHVRNALSRFCGWIIVAAVIVAGRTKGDVFVWAEVVAVSAFGLSWLIKGGAFSWLNDTPEPPPLELSEKPENTTRTPAQAAECTATTGRSLTGNRTGN